MIIFKNKIINSLTENILKIYNICVFVPISFIFIYINYRMYFPGINNKFLNTKGILSILLVFVSLFLLFIAYRLVIDKITENNKTITILITIIMTFFLILQVSCALIFAVNPSWDFGCVLTAAYEISENKPLSNIEYFSMYPHNLNPALLLGLTIKFFGGFEIIPFVLNIIFVFASVIAIYFVLKIIFGIKTALLSLIFCFLSTPLYLYMPIAYTDTLSMPFAVFPLLLWALFKQYCNKISTKYKIILLTSIGLISAVGFLIKPLSTFVLFAITIELFISEISKNLYTKKENDENNETLNFIKQIFFNKKMTFIIPIASFIIFLSLFQYLINSTEYKKSLVQEKAFPYTHWLMLGLNTPITSEDINSLKLSIKDIEMEKGETSYGYGGYSSYDVLFSSSFDTYTQRKTSTIEVICKRLNYLGFSGYIKFLLKKLESTWNDGTFYAPVKLARQPLNKTFFHNLILFNPEKTNKPFITYSQIFHSIILFFIVCLYLFALKNYNKMMEGQQVQYSYIRICSLACLFLVVFLLIWETRSRYLTYFIPILNSIAAIGSIRFFNLLSLNSNNFLPKILRNKK